MDKNINFLGVKARALKKRAKELFFIQTGFLVFLAIYGLSIVAVSSYHFILKKESNVLKEKIAGVKTQIEGLRPIETKQVYLKSKVKSLGEVLTGQKQNQKMAEAVFTLLSEGISINSFTIDKEGAVKFSGQSKEFKTMKIFFIKLESTPRIGEMEIKRVKIGGVSFDYKKGYTFSVYLLFEG